MVWNPVQQQPWLCNRVSPLSDPFNGEQGASGRQQPSEAASTKARDLRLKLQDLTVRRAGGFRLCWTRRQLYAGCPPLLPFNSVRTPASSSLTLRVRCFPHPTCSASARTWTPFGACRWSGKTPASGTSGKGKPQLVHTCYQQFPQPRTPLTSSCVAPWPCAAVDTQPVIPTLYVRWWRRSLLRGGKPHHFAH